MNGRLTAARNDVGSTGRGETDVAIGVNAAVTVVAVQINGVVIAERHLAARGIVQNPVTVADVYVLDGQCLAAVGYDDVAGIIVIDDEAAHTGRKRV